MPLAVSCLALNVLRIEGTREKTLTMKSFALRFLLAVLLLLANIQFTRAEDAAANDDAAAGDDANGDDDGMEDYGNNNNNNNNNAQQYQNDDGSIKYWTDYAIVPKRCIVYNNVDMIVFTMHPNGYKKQCQDNPLGTYITPVATFVGAYLDDMASEMADVGQNYEYPAVSQYVSCSPFVIENVEYYFQLGCADGTTQGLAVNIYKDDACTQRSTVEGGWDDSNIDVSEIQLPFKKCHACVNWYDMNDDVKVDDQWFENHQTNSPLCSTAWTEKQTCNKQCQHKGLETATVGWNTPDKVLVSILCLFSVVMLGLIIRKRQKMSNKDALLEQAAMSAAGLQPPHVIGIFLLVILVVAVFALLGLKNITWALLLLINTALFAYLMKLTVDSSVSTGETVIGPDGTIMRQDSDDSSMEGSESNRRAAGTYVLPRLT